jgi:hypothetical protein
MDWNNIISFHGDVIKTTYQTLKEVFGNPTGCDLDGKVQYEWELTTDNGTQFYIYDWREPIDVRTAEVEWHIGRTSISGDEIKEFLASKGFTTDNIYFK